MSRNPFSHPDGADTRRATRTAGVGDKGARSRVGRPYRRAAARALRRQPDRARRRGEPDRLRGRGGVWGLQKRLDRHDDRRRGKRVGLRLGGADRCGLRRPRQLQRSRDLWWGRDFRSVAQGEGREGATAAPRIASGSQTSPPTFSGRRALDARMLPSSRSVGTATTGGRHVHRRSPAE